MINNLHKDAILQTLATHKLQLADFGVRQIGLFGSYVRNEATENSDIDLLVDIRKDKKPSTIFSLLTTIWKNFLAKK